MSYAYLLDVLETEIIKGPHLAVALRKPGEDTGIWLFGETHTKPENRLPEHYDIHDSINIVKLLAENDINSVILLYEGFNLPGKPLFQDAPDDIKTIANSLTPDRDIRERYGLVDGEPSESDLDELGYFKSEISADDETKEMFNKPESIEYMINQTNSGYMEGAGFLYSINDGDSINIENKIRAYAVDVLRENEEVDPDDFFTVIGWALKQSVPPEATIMAGETGIELLTRESARMFFEQLLRVINHHWAGEIPGIFGEIVGEMRVLIEDAPDTESGIPYMFVKDKVELSLRFVHLFMFIMMDMNIVPRMKAHPGKDFVSYCGAKHVVNQIVILHHLGYVIEHTFFEDEFNFISEDSKQRHNIKIFDDEPLSRTIDYLQTAFLRVD